MEADEKTCPKCAETVKAAAAVCKHCGHNFVSGNANRPAQPEKSKPSVMRIVLMIFGGLIALVFIIGLFSGDPGPSPQAKSAEGTAAASSAPEIKVTARDLANAYEANEAAAQQRFAGHKLLVTGIVDGVDLDFSNDPIVKLKTGDFLSAQASLTDAGAKKSASLTKGQSATLICGGVSEVMGTPMLSDCEIQ